MRAYRRDAVDLGIDRCGGPAIPPQRDTGWAMSQENVEVVRRFLDALSRRDDAAAMPLLAEDVEWHMFPAGVGPEVFHGPNDVREAGIAFLSAWDKADLEIAELFDAGDAVVARLRWSLRGKASGLATTTEYSAVYTVRAGQIVRYQEYASPRRALEAVGLRD
jgi:ketosteroid isomerase-like protein